MAKELKNITIDDVQQITSKGSATKVINGLLKKKLISAYENLNENYKPKTAKYVWLHSHFNKEENVQQLFTELEKAPKQLAILLSFFHLKKTEKFVPQTELLKNANATTAQLNALIEKNIFYTQKVEVDRIKYEYEGAKVENILNEVQQIAFNEIEIAFKKNKPVLLKGITGSGKTHIYFKLIETCLAQGKQALYLLPEIALTTQIVHKLRATFGNLIGIYHSRFSNDERVEIWHKTLQAEYKIIIGARSALLLPFKNVGLIIVDEEHDISYKQQDPTPRYHARDSALMLAKLFQANIILGSATPSVESYYNVQQNKYELVEITQRYGNAQLPNMELIDMKLALQEKKVTGIFSNQLIQKIQEAILNKKQVILFQNRRGYSPFIICSTCGWVPHCKYCDVSLTYHKHTDLLHCHYCGSKSAVLKTCLACGNTQLHAKSFGTEKIEEEIKQIFPHARVQRFDWDTMQTKNKHQEIIHQFEKHELDILVGTQMLVKGLDFENVALVGVLSVDSLLSYPDFRVNERVYQLLEQVSGRAGRKDKNGEVLVQVQNVSHPILQLVKEHNYPLFFETELQIRNDFQYPPFTRLIKITLKHRDKIVVEQASILVADKLKNLPKTILFGPAEPSIARVKNKFIQEILCKVNRDSEHLHFIKQTIKNALALMQHQKGFTTVQSQIDVDTF